MKNDYLEQVQAKQQRLEQDLRRNSPISSLAEEHDDVPAQAVRAARRVTGGTSGAGFQNVNSAAVNVRITGFWRWKTVVVPPNAYVIHTRRGHNEPLHLGMGVSFRFNPYADSFIVVPSTMQTILINADCICRELQGLLVQGYLQWIIGDFSTAYKKLDFSDTFDPMRVVNVQLREQAEAAIKDKVATMSIDEVLSDKQPIIEELTTRLRQVAEGGGDPNKGLGLSIVTVQIKEAVVSSANLWQNLQKPFRAEREQFARIAELNAQSIIQAREIEHETTRTTSQIQNESQLANLRAEKESQVFDREQIEKVRRQQKEQEVMRQIIVEQNITTKQEQQAKREIEESALKNALALEIARMQTKHEEFLKENQLRIAQLAKEIEAANSIAELDKVRLEKEAELVKLKTNAEVVQKDIAARGEIALQEMIRVSTNHQTQIEIEFETSRQKILNGISSNHLGAQLIDTLPSIVEKLPKPDELRTISIGTDSQPIQTLTTLVAQILSIINGFTTSTTNREKNE